MTFPSTVLDCYTDESDLKSDIVGNPELDLLLDGLSKLGHSSDLLRQACKMLPISNLEFISISATSELDIHWVELFSCCTNVTEVEAIGFGTSSLVEALAATTVTNAGSRKEGRKRICDNSDRESTVAPGHPAIFPKLKSLGLFGLDFSKRISISETLFDIVERGLQQRMAASGAPLEFLRITDCESSAKRANRLKKFVEKLDFDGGGWWWPN